jgi:hypothetical protein
MRCHRYDHRSRTTQFNLFAPPGDTAVPTPAWGALPEEVRQALTRLMVQLVLDHEGDAREPREARDDV